MQERKFREVCKAIDVDPEAEIPVQVVPGGQTFSGLSNQEQGVRILWTLEEHGLGRIWTTFLPVYGISD